jgi:hypothetical protein
VRFDDLEPGMLSRFIERLESSHAPGNGFKNFDQVVDAFTIAWATKSKNEADFCNTLVRELYNDLRTNENVLPKRLQSKESIQKVSSVLTTLYEHEDWGNNQEAHLFPWIDLLIAAIAHAMASKESPATIDMESYSLLGDALESKKWKGRFFRQLRLRFDAHYKHNKDKKMFTMEPLEIFLL